MRINWGLGEKMGLNERMHGEIAGNEGYLRGNMET